MKSRAPLPVFRVDAFVAKGFLGNVACVIPLIEWLDDDELLRIAAENGDEAALTALLDAKIVNIEGADSVSGVGL